MARILTNIGRYVAVVILGGAVGLSLALFWLTFLTPGPVTYLGPACAVNTVKYPGFDPWTGEPHGRIYDCAELDGSGVKRVTTEPPDELVSRKVVPVPMGFTLGAVTTFIALLYRRWARWRG